MSRELDDPTVGMDSRITRRRERVTWFQKNKAMLREQMNFEEFKTAVHSAIGIDFTVRLQAAGGAQHKVFPPTYLNDDPVTKTKFKAKYATESRIMDGNIVPTVLLDSVPSQANRMEQALLAAIQDRQLAMPLFSVAVEGHGVVTSIDAPHRALDAIFLDSDVDHQSFLASRFGSKLAESAPHNATALFQYAPTSLVFGMWNSHTGKAGGRFARIIASEIIGWGAMAPGVKTASRIDPLEIGNGIELYKVPTIERWGWKKYENQAKDKPSGIGHSNIPPTINDTTGGISLEHIQQQAVLSLLALQSLHFPDAEGQTDRSRDEAARTVLAALAFVALTLQFHQGYQLRSGCLLQAVESPRWRLLHRMAADDVELSVTLEESLHIYREAVAAAEAIGLTWGHDIPQLVPSAKLMELVKQSDQQRIMEPEPGQGA